METSLADPLVGRLLDGRYQVEALVARGGMAAVYLATDTRLDRRVALKVMHADLARDEDFVRRFIGEAKSVARLSHPNVVAVFDQGSDGQYLYLAMEYVPGRTLRDLLSERGRFSPREALAIMVPLLSGLAAAHRAGIVHRDVKPENVLVTPDGGLKVVDFGVARALTVGSQTRSGLIIGTVAYLAPEQVTGTGADARTDVYAAGIVLFELLTGVQPYTAETPLAVAYKHVNSDVPAPSALAPEVPPAVDRLVAMATSRDPRWRPADADAFLQAARDTGLAAPESGTAVLAADPGIPEHLTQALPRPGGHTLVAPHEELGGHGGHRRGGPRRLLRGYGRVLAGLALAIAVIAAAGGWLLARGADVTIPPVSGMTVQAATVKLRGDGFAVRAGTPVADNRVPKGMVVRTVPAAGSRAPTGTAITLVASAGPVMIKIPVVAGQPLARARAVLRGAGLTVSGHVRTAVSPSVGAGLVIGTQPGAGTSWPQLRPVTILLSEGPPLPDFAGQNVQAAQQWAQGHGVTLNVQQHPSGSQPPGTVIGQSPAAGTPVRPGETLTVVVSSGPQQVTIPDVTGMSVGDAKNTLKKLGFKVNVRKIGPFNLVFGYLPHGQAPQGSTVTIFAGF
ncbi:MAG TPA: Stk1 family PASTA domain-containing Ser/Thr kinase [Streptosporangiaceae bacterium]|nr:Stk1 family PASTA domain-containing Ser/Thr kinase [Streptosporangiaceae bacterium]